MLKIRIPLLALLLILFSACAPAPTPAANTPPAATGGATPTTTRAVTPTSTATVPSPTPARHQPPTQPPENPRRKETPLPTPTRLVPTLTPVPPKEPEIPDPSALIVWAADLGEPQYVPGFYGYWSPTANELVGFLRNPEGDKSLVVTSGPDFKLQPVKIDSPFVTRSLNWSPDGRRIIFSAPPQTADPTDGRYSTLWMMNHNGLNPHRLTTHDWDYDMLWFPGWMDGRYLLIADYGGGGHWGVEKVDTWNETSEGVLSIHGPVYQPSAKYIPVVYETITDNYVLVVVSDEPQPEAGWARLIDGGWEYTRLFPANRDDVPAGDEDGFWAVLFDEWLPGTNRMFYFAYAAGPEDTLLKTSIGEWNLDTNETRVWAPNGIEAWPSPDAKLLALTTLGQLPIATDGSLKDAPLPDADHRQPFLNLLDEASGKVLLQAPVLAEEDDWLGENDYSQISYTSYVNFSPDSRYLAFLSPGNVALDTGGPIAAWEPGLVLMNVLDIQSRQLVFTASISDLPLWSPKSDRLVYQKKDGNWVMYDLVQGVETAITEAGGSNVDLWNFSFSASYLSFVTRTPDPNNPDYSPISGMLILTLPER